MMKRIIKINESVADSLLSDLLTESFTPQCQQVLIVKKYLDDNYSKSEIFDTDGDMPRKVKTVTMLSSSGEPLEVIQVSDTDGHLKKDNKLILRLDDKFCDMIKDDSDRMKFMQRVFVDWYNNAIKPGGVLSVNFID